MAGEHGVSKSIGAYEKRRAPLQADFLQLRHQLPRNALPSVVRAREELEHLASEGAGLRIRHVELDYTDHFVRVVGVEDHDDLASAGRGICCIVLPHL